MREEALSRLCRAGIGSHEPCDPGAQVKKYHQRFNRKSVLIEKSRELGAATEIHTSSPSEANTVEKERDNCARQNGVLQKALLQFL